MPLEMKMFYVPLHNPPSSCLLSVLSVVRALHSGCISALAFPRKLGGIEKFLPLCLGLAKPLQPYSCSLHQNRAINQLGNIYMCISVDLNCMGLLFQYTPNEQLIRSS